MTLPMITPLTLGPDVTNEDLSNQANSGLLSTSFTAADLGSEWIYIFSGIAVPNLKADSSVVILLASNQIREVRGVTATIGLCHIENGDTLFSLDSIVTSVVLSSTGQLQLSVLLTLTGEKTYLRRFSYQVVAAVTPEP